MKIKVDMKKLVALMREKEIGTLCNLGKECGLSKNFTRELHRTGTLSKESLWLISDRLEVPINEIVYPEW